MVPEIAQFVWFDFVLLGFIVVHIALPGAVSCPFGKPAQECSEGDFDRGTSGWRSDCAGCVGLGQRRLEVPGHPVSWILFHNLRISGEGQHVIEGVKLVGTTGFDRSHEGVSRIRPALGPVMQTVLAMQDRVRPPKRFGRIRG